MKMIQWRKPEGKTISVLMAGDFCPREENSAFVAENYKEITAGLKDVFDEADIRILQWETVITQADTPILKQGPNLRCSADCLNFSKNLGIDVHLLANNHTGDFGPDAVMETIRHCDSANIRTVGAGKNLKDALKPLIFDSPAGKIGIINVCENEFGIATEDEAGAAPLDVCDNMELIRKTRKEVDILIMAVHGGHEFNPFPSPRMVKSYRAFAVAGADIVFNCHTHCISGTEVYENVPVVYSPGNFFFPGDQYSMPSWYFGYLCKFYCDTKGCFGYEIIPYTFDNSRMRLMNEDELQKFEKHYDFICDTIQNKEKTKKIFDAWSCYFMGNSYLSIINNIKEEKFPPDWNNEDIIKRWIHIKNDFCCESHNDMMRNYTYLIANRKVEKAAEYRQLMEEYYQPSWMKDLIDNRK